MAYRGLVLYLSLLHLSCLHNSPCARFCLVILLSSGIQFPELHILHAPKLPLLDQTMFSLLSYERYYRNPATGMLENQMLQKDTIQKEIIKHIYLSGYGKYEMILLLGQERVTQFLTSPSYSWCT